MKLLTTAAELRYEAGMYQSLYENAKNRTEALETALQQIVQWSEAYPPNIFPEPDWNKAAELLKAGGITMDAVSAHCMRHVVEGVGEIARAALEPEPLPKTILDEPTRPPEQDK